jgi:hypothetical protein
MNTYVREQAGMMHLACLSYGKDFQLIPNYTGAVGGGRIGDFIITKDDYGLSVRQVDTENAQLFDLLNFELRSMPIQGLSSIAGWSVWKDGMTEKGEPLKLLEFPPSTME